ncbi:M1 family metallopeptidase [Rummeliibacillus sp. TYF-LIM-RU47]|uniref:M1 family metallopeptidase n=1 Tax=Rummeliibacillus sp. TYF-LIM-RU47 TaxID=2608406 RepID=UPI001238486A|nr:M1 family metallopeptidase [Rummeliibacillus sp. TYF-LIM-RU47]
MSQKYKPITQPFGSKTKYKINLEMDSRGHFNIESRSTIKNTSNDKWSDVVFYFIPNIFTKENSPTLSNPGTAHIKSILVNGKKAKFSLKKDSLKVLLHENVYPTKKIVVDIQYSFTLPEKGFRFNKEDGNYYLAQWYPMVATYKNGSWNKEEYRVKGETYHTAFSDFEVSYKIPKGLTIVSTSDQEYVNSKNKSTLKMKNVKDFYITILKKPYENERKIGNVNIRAFTIDDDTQSQREVLQIAEKALNYFQDKIGPYPHKQLDIIVSQSGMEYPGIVTAGSIKGGNSDWRESVVVHEIAHQWFYGMISSDPFHDAWLDEGIANFATSLFYSKYKKEPISLLDVSEFQDSPLPVNLPLNKYTLGEQSNYIYAKAPTYLWKVFSENGGQKRAEDFLKSYYNLYKYKDIDTAEFVRFIKYYLDLKNDASLKEFLEF